ncbi:hypothetical protein [Pararhodospirillum oryzae]|uniref:Uncharacterized protein n=1 Tax=Pararhodospirillum oryzae TaxID=478448 RepID=A0A512HBT2_9PROT|nr:hypothetical protein [Pararhodospirillum oryzae]GEO82850.1 hypothetical protein ROR02_29810 [Pararhodospirillum oryzae]
MWALIIDGLVSEITPLDPAGRYHPSLTWVEVPESLRPWVGPGWTEADGFRPPDGFATHLVARIDILAGEARQRWVTDVPGQEGTYQAKAAEAAALASDPAPDPAEYPYLSAEAVETGASLAETAALVAATAAAWAQANATIEARRRGWKTRAAAATSPADLLVILSDLHARGWPTPTP